MARSEQCLICVDLSFPFLPPLAPAKVRVRGYSSARSPTSVMASDVNLCNNREVESVPNAFGVLTDQIIQLFRLEVN